VIRIDSGLLTKKLTLVMVILLVASVTRLVGLGERPADQDELNYRGKLHSALAVLGTQDFRNNHIRNEQGAPFGLAGHLISISTGKFLFELFGPWWPDHDYRRDNILCRLPHAIAGILSCWILFLISGLLFSQSSAFLTGMLAALSPLAINWSRSEHLDAMMTLFSFMAIYFALMAVECWRARTRSLAFLVLSGGATALALGCKWSALVLTGALPLAAYGAVLSRRNLTRKKLFELADFHSGAAFLIGWAPVALCFHSIESFRIILFPDPTDNMGDPFWETGLSNVVRYAVRQFDGYALLGMTLLVGSYEYVAAASIFLFFVYKAEVRMRPGSVWYEFSFIMCNFDSRCFSDSGLALRVLYLSKNATRTQESAGSDHFSRNARVDCGALLCQSELRSFNCPFTE